MAWDAKRMGHYCDKCDVNLKFGNDGLVYAAFNIHGPMRDKSRLTLMFCDQCLMGIRDVIVAACGKERLSDVIEANSVKNLPARIEVVWETKRLREERESQPGSEGDEEPPH